MKKNWSDRARRRRSSCLEAASTWRTALRSLDVSDADRMLSMDQSDLLPPTPPTPTLLCDGGLERASSLRIDAMSLSLGMRISVVAEAPAAAPPLAPDADAADAVAVAVVDVEAPVAFESKSGVD